MVSKFLMYPLNDRQYLAICSKIANLLSVSLLSAKKKVEIEIVKKGSKTIEEKIEVAKDILKLCEKDNENKLSSPKIRSTGTRESPNEIS